MEEGRNGNKRYEASSEGQEISYNLCNMISNATAKIKESRGIRNTVRIRPHIKIMKAKEEHLS